MNNYEHFMERFELMILCREVCDSANYTAIYHALIRHDIYSIDDLRNADINTISKFNCIGEMRLEFIKEMKLIIEDEEKIRNTLEQDMDYARIHTDPKLFEKAKALYYTLKCSHNRVSKILGLRVDTCVRIKHA